ncbi:hypothetical protein [Variovorax rhizosphaerae]|uniref:Uncharacterized protein n=1 Tax=Variovorax rhizosphaerae TaxID=1836200 RepID=A0ABU8WD76_9BURK
MPNRSKLPGVGMAILVIALAGGAAWYAVHDSNTLAPVESDIAVPALAPPEPEAPPAPAMVAAPEPVPEPEPAAVISKEMQQPRPAEVVPPPRPPVAAPPKPRKVATVATPVAPPAAVVAPPVSTEPPPPPPDPESVCGRLNFIAKALCMADQCAKAEFKATAQCEAVRAQQRIEEEKRNPTLAH